MESSKLDTFYSEFKKYNCKECGKRFKLKKYLKDHEIKHTDIKKFDCTECQRKYKYKRGLIRHLKMKHNIENSTLKISIKVEENLR